MKTFRIVIEFQAEDKEQAEKAYKEAVNAINTAKDANCYTIDSKVVQLP